jgi:cell division protein FtsB
VRHAHSRAAGSALRLNERLVRERDRARARELRRFVLYGAVIALPLLAYLWQRVAFLELSYRVEALSRERQELVDRKKALTVERSLLLSPQRIESVARRQLGLVDPLPEDVKRVRLIDGRVGEVGGPVAAVVPAPVGGRP